MTRHQALWITLLLSIPVLWIGFGLRNAGLQQYPPGISNDEAINAVDAFYFSTTGIQPLYEEFEGREPLFRLIQGAAMLFFGKSVWAVRMVSVLFSLPFIASTMWVTSIALRDYPRHVRTLAMIAAGLVLATMMGNIVISRSIYRAPIFYLSMSLSMGFMLHGLSSQQRRAYILSGLWGGLTLYTYTAAWFFPFSFVVLAIALLITRIKSWRIWLPNLIMTGVSAALICLPILYLLLTNPDSVFVRAGAVASAEAVDWLARLRGVRTALFVSGDPNPQYNAHIAPLIDGYLRWVFYAGFVTLLIRIRRAESWFLAAIFVLMIFPAILSNEVQHGLRLSGQFVIIPVIIGLGAGLSGWLINRIIKKPVIVLAIGLIAAAYFAVTFVPYTWSRYTTFYDEPERWRLWRIYDRQLTHNEWFFRTDRRLFGEWVAAQDFPMLVPVAELDRQSTRSWLMNNYQVVTSAGIDIYIPDDTQIVMPFALELNDLMTDEQQFALLNDGVITLLPRLSEASRNALIAEIESGSRIDGEGQLSLAGYSLPVDVAEIEFEIPHVSDDMIATFNNGDIALTGWSGDDTLTDETLEFALEWHALRRIGHSYMVSLQLQTQAYDRIIGNDSYLMRWAYPTLAWKRDVPIWSSHTLSVPDGLQPGAYRLTLGVFYPVAPLVPAEAGSSAVLNDRVTVGWLKVPQDEPVIPDSATEVDLTIDEIFDLTHLEFIAGNDGQLFGQLHWQSLEDRPPVDATIFVHIVDEDGQIVAQSDSRPQNGQYPTFIWDKNETIRTDHVFNFNDIDTLNAYRVRIGMYTFPGPVNLPVSTSDRRIDDGLIMLGSLANFVTMPEEE